MSGAAQRMALRLYAAWSRCPASRWPLSRRIFWGAYRLYKSWFEAGDLEFLRGHVSPGSSVIDVGANVGFFTSAFANWVSGGGRVFAFEPEGENFRELARMLRGHARGGAVDAVRAAVADLEGEIPLAVNLSHPGDHRISDSGEKVPCVTLDRFLAGRGWPQVSLIKVDVQGAEMRVLRGAADTLSRCRPALFVEVADGTLRQMGSSAEELLARLDALGYRALRRAGRGGCRDVTSGDILSRVRGDGYLDVLFVPRGRGATGT